MSGIARFRNPGSHFESTSIDGDLNFVRNSEVSTRRELTVFPILYIRTTYLRNYLLHSFDLGCAAGTTGHAHKSSE